MNGVFAFFLIILLNEFSAYYISPDNHKITSINSFAFGSCYNLHKNVSKYEIFNVIDKNHPDVFMWLGDAAYVRFSHQSKYKLIRRYKYYFSIFDEFNLAKVLRRFNNTKNSVDYRPFDLKYPTIGVWDDNDYGQNDGNKYFKYKEEMKEIFLDFLDEPRNSTRRSPGKAIYTTYTFGDKNSYKNIRVILLDVRYNKSSLIDTNRDILGEDQWEWFGNVLENANETFIFIASGTQILPIDRLFSECWFPESRLRLFNLLRKVKKNGVVLLTGDIHNGQLLRTPCIIEGIGYKLIEITSSGLGHYCKPNCDFAIDYVLPNYYKFTPTINDYNYAQIDFDWGNFKEEAKMIVKLIDMDNTIRTNVIITLKELTNNNDIDDKFVDSVCLDKVSSRFKSLKEYYHYYTHGNKLYLYILLAGICVMFSGLLNLYFIMRAICKRRRRKNKAKLIKEKKE